MRKVGLPKGQTEAFVAHLMAQAAVFAPTLKKKCHSFERITSAGEAALDYKTTILPPKKFFQPEFEILFKFNRENLTVETPKEELPEAKILLGVHNYDMQGILDIDYAMNRGNKDEGWTARRAGWLFVGVSYTPDDYHFSPSVGINPGDRKGLDVFLNKADGGYNVEILTEAGEKLVNGFGGFGASMNEEPMEHKFANKLVARYEDLPALMAKAVDNPIWKKNAEKCFSCGSCTLVCPTCYCFDVQDDLALSLKEGNRVKRWDSCQLMPFTEVAGGEVFRHDRSARVAHRIYRKFKYITEHFGKPFCVGCGRCTRACTAKISITEIVNEIARGETK